MKNLLCFIGGVVFTILLLCFATVIYAETNTISSTVSGTVTGTTTVDRTPSTAMAPNIMINQNDMCKSGIGAGVQSQVLGIAMGATIDDENCERIKLSRSLFQMGMKVAAVSTLCQDARVFDAMMQAGTPCPIEGKIGKEALALWEVNNDQVPDGSKWKPSKKEAKVKLIGPIETELNKPVVNRPMGATIQPYKKPEEKPSETFPLEEEPPIEQQ